MVEQKGVKQADDWAATTVCELVAALGEIEAGRLVAS